MTDKTVRTTGSVQSDGGDGGGGVAGVAADGVETADATNLNPEGEDPLLPRALELGKSGRVTHRRIKTEFGIGSDRATRLARAVNAEVGAGFVSIPPVSETNPPVSELQAASPVAPSPERDEYGALRVLYDQLTLSEADDERLWVKRGLPPEVSEALGFRSSQEGNRDLILALREEYADSLLERLGLMHEGKPNAQFYGYGVMGKKKATPGPEADEPLDDADEEDARLARKRDTFEWGWTHPVLIPYYEEGRLVGLRPHKGMSKKTTLLGQPRLYVPNWQRDQRWDTVWVTEGEFKAAALWQLYGEGWPANWGPRIMPPIGVCSLPGITFANHYAVRQTLDRWIKDVGARKVVVTFDSEEKGDSKLPGYKADWRKRWDAQIWSRYLCMSLERDLGVEGYVLEIPPSYRDAKGKADWDGILARSLHDPNSLPGT